MRHLLFTVMLSVGLMAACTPADDTMLPTVAQLPTLAATEISHIASPTPVTRPTLPPTFTPTTPPTDLPPTATAQPSPTLQTQPTSMLGSPQVAPENYPVNVRVRGGGFDLSLDPPSAIRYTQAAELHQLRLAYNGGDGQTFTLALTMLGNLTPGDYPVAACADTDGTLAADDDLCLSAVYTNTGLVAANLGGGWLTLSALEPLEASLSVDLSATPLPANDANRYNANAPVTLTLEVEGQARTN